MKKKINVARPTSKPEGAGVLTRYEQLREKARKFAEGKYNLLVIAGGPGLAKTTTFKRARTGGGAGLLLHRGERQPVRGVLQALSPPEQTRALSQGGRFGHPWGLTNQKIKREQDNDCVSHCYMEPRTRSCSPGQALRSLLDRQRRRRPLRQARRRPHASPPGRLEPPGRLRPRRQGPTGRRLCPATRPPPRRVAPSTPGSPSPGQGSPTPVASGAAAAGRPRRGGPRQATAGGRSPARQGAEPQPD